MITNRRAVLTLATATTATGAHAKWPMDRVMTIVARVIAEGLQKR